MATVALSTKAVGSVVKIKESGTYREFYVAKHGYHLPGNGRTLLVRKNLYNLTTWDVGGSTQYPGSSIDTALEGAYFNILQTSVEGVSRTV